VPRSLTVLLAGLALLASACGSSDKEQPAQSTETATSTPAATGGCGKGQKPGAKDVGTIAKPKAKLDPSKHYVATVSTNCGDFEIALDAKRAPKTGGNFKYLADKGFFNGLWFHRIDPGFVIQGGDPAGDGSGGPGYTVVEKPPADLTYDEGVVAMAKTQTDPAGASGSQFFVVTGPKAAQLPPDYALLGTVTGGKDVVRKIGNMGIIDQGTPTGVVVIKNIRVAVS